jgi:hypothetical protein
MAFSFAGRDQEVVTVGFPGLFTAEIAEFAEKIKKKTLRSLRTLR